MKYLIILFLTTKLYGQIPTKTQIDAYVKTIDSLKKLDKLKKVFYPNMSVCGGSLSGYYLNTKLVFIDSKYSAEFGYTRQLVYLKDTTFYKITYQVHVPKRDKYYINTPDSYNINKSKITYTDTTFNIILTEPPIITKSSKNKISGNTIESESLKTLINCGHIMVSELRSVKTSR